MQTGLNLIQAEHMQMMYGYLNHEHADVAGWSQYYTEEESLMAIEDLSSADYKKTLCLSIDCLLQC